MFLTIWLNGTLDMMQNDVKTSEFEHRSMEIHLFLDDCLTTTLRRRWLFSRATWFVGNKGF